MRSARRPTACRSPATSSTTSRFRQRRSRRAGNARALGRRRPAWIAGSTHEGEEEAALRAHALRARKAPRRIAACSCRGIRSVSNPCAACCASAACASRSAVPASCPAPGTRCSWSTRSVNCRRSTRRRRRVRRRQPRADRRAQPARAGGARAADAVGPAHAQRPGHRRIAGAVRRAAGSCAARGAGRALRAWLDDPAGRAQRASEASTRSRPTAARSTAWSR